MSLELRDARAAVVGGRFDASKAVEEQLRKSFQTRCALEESVAEGEEDRPAPPRPAAALWERGAALTPASRAPRSSQG